MCLDRRCFPLSRPVETLHSAFAYVFIARGTAVAEEVFQDRVVVGRGGCSSPLPLYRGHSCSCLRCSHIAATFSPVPCALGQRCPGLSWTLIFSQLLPCGRNLPNISTSYRIVALPLGQSSWAQSFTSKLPSLGASIVTVGRSQCGTQQSANLSLPAAYCQT